MKEAAQEALKYLQDNLLLSIVIAALAGFAGMKTVSFAKKTNPALFFIVGALGVFLGQFAILYFGLKGIIDEISEFRLLFDLLAAYIGSFVVASLINFFSPH
jgi:uncharacterized membrane protein YeaQ/YmgE (transglycosylase-associated protein family)